MPDSNGAPLRDPIRRALASHAGLSPSAGSLADATLDTWDRMATRLVPVIGAQGVDVLFRRSLHMTSAAFPWLAVTGARRDATELQAELKARLAGRGIEAAREAGHDLLVTFVSLLATLIGESLTERLLAPIWESPVTTARKGV